ncbi:MAG: CotH kinase family protein [Clostridia bacterium]|nr:CotH kinase family protein [Clostridia bacterium]
MKKFLLKFMCAVIALTFIVTAAPLTLAASAEDSLFYILPDDNAGLSFAVGSYEKSSSVSYMFLPNTVDATNVYVRCKRTPSSVSGSGVVSYSSSGKYVIVDTTAGNVSISGKSLVFMQSSLPGMSIVLNEGESIDTINNDKNARIGASASISGAENPDHNLAPLAIEMKTRGNTTFWPDKKPYQIKFDKKQDLFGMGKAKKWILLANYYDGTSIRTKVFFDLAEEIGMTDTPKSVFIDLYIDGNYRGVYELTEKIEVGTTRVDLKDEYGVILEMESNQRTDPQNDIYFRTRLTSKDILYKDYVYDFEDTSSAERIAKISEIRAFVENYINTFESEMFAQDPDWDTISSMIDVDSFILYYFLNEYGEQVDCTLASTYFYIDGADDVLHCGPVWDFDRVCGFNDPVPKNTDYIKNITDNTDKYRVEWFKELFRNPEFVKRANELYTERIKAAFDTAKVNAMIDSYQEMLMPSLLMNHKKWVVFYDRTATADEFISTGTIDEIAYITNNVKSILSDKKAYMDMAYSKYLPTLSYTTYSIAGVEGKAYTGGCATYKSVNAGLAIELIDSPIDGSITYSLNCDGEVTGTYRDGELAKSASGFKYFTGVYINLEGNITNYCTIQYRVCIGGTWYAWTNAGRLAGRTSSSNGTYCVERIQIRLLLRRNVTLTNVHFVADGVETVTQSTVAGNSFTTDYEPQREKYTFTGWYKDEDRTIPAEFPFTAIGSNYTFYAGMVKDPVLLGDADADGVVTLKDISHLKAYIAGIITVIDDVDTIDIECDGVVNLKDLSALKILIAG